MKVKDLLKTITRLKKTNENIDDFDVYVQVINGAAYKNKKQAGWDFIKDTDDFEYIKCEGSYTAFPSKKIFTINVDY